MIVCVSLLFVAFINVCLTTAASTPENFRISLAKFYCFTLIIILIDGKTIFFALMQVNPQEKNKYHKIYKKYTFLLLGKKNEKKSTLDVCGLTILFVVVGVVVCFVIFSALKNILLLIKTYLFLRWFFIFIFFFFVCVTRAPSRFYAQQPL